MSSNEKILVVTTGGTIDAKYDPEDKTPYYVPVPPTAEDTAVPAAMEKMGIASNCDFLRFSMKDSKDVTHEELDRIVEHVIANGYSKVIVVTGTDRMADLGQYMEKKIGQTASLIFTGAMGPLRDKEGNWRDPQEKTYQNDGWENLRRAKHDLDKGVPMGAYIRMGKGFWPVSRVTKEVEVDDSGPTAIVVESGFRATVHPESKGPGIPN